MQTVDEILITPTTCKCVTCKNELNYDLFLNKKGKKCRTCLDCREKKKSQRVKKPIIETPKQIEDIKITEDIKIMKQNTVVEKVEQQILPSIPEKKQETIIQMEQPVIFSMPEKKPEPEIKIESISTNILGQPEIKEEKKQLTDVQMKDLIKKLKVMTDTLKMKETDVSKMSESEFLETYKNVYESYVLFIGSSNTEALLGLGCGYLDLYSDWIEEKTEGRIITTNLCETINKKQKQLRPYYTQFDLTDQMKIFRENPLIMLGVIMASAVAENTSQQKKYRAENNYKLPIREKRGLEPKPKTT